MAKYQNKYREETPENIEEETFHAPVTETEDDTFKKRYGDLRRHMQQTLADKDRELEQMKSQLQDASQKQIKFPKTEKEIAEWVKKYPDVAAIVDTIAQRRSLEAVKMNEGKIQRLEKLEKRLDKERAQKELKMMHPDFDQIRQSKKFHTWASEQPKWVQDALYTNETDARAAARAIDLYKADVGVGVKRAKTAEQAAEAVGRTSGSTPNGSGKATFSESQVEKMSAREYEQNQDAIMDAMRSGRFEYDLSGAAS